MRYESYFQATIADMEVTIAYGTDNDIWLNVGQLEDNIIWYVMLDPDNPTTNDLKLTAVFHHRHAEEVMEQIHLDMGLQERGFMADAAAEAREAAIEAEIEMAENLKKLYTR